METAKIKSILPFVLAAATAFLLYSKKYTYALYVGLALAAWLGYDLYEKKSAEAGAEA
jgi:hypothetical protein